MGMAAEFAVIASLFMEDDGAGLAREMVQAGVGVVSTTISVVTLDDALLAPPEKV